ncbi:MAG: 5'-methylthioadenosine/S-adenosylhomocysteine nucleosidase [Clostridia bacterium]|nr:5'-methylthioadenosine/S-adenosylhomocysteine nucleosidase [Clostridia bacterium]
MLGGKIGVVIADDWEFEPLKKWAEKFSFSEKIENKNDCIEFESGGNRIVAVKCGIGKVNAAFATSFLIFEEKCDIILNIGLSGAIKNLHKNDIVVGSEYIECDFDLTAIGRKPGEKPGQEYLYCADEKLLSFAKKCSVDSVCRLGTGDIFLADKALKEKYSSLFDVCAFDMETAAIAAVCHRTDTPFISIRKISDDCDENAMESYSDLNKKKETHLSEVLEELLSEIRESY